MILLKQVKNSISVALLLASVTMVSSAYALDVKDTSKAENPFESFKTGVSAYKNGNKEEAVKALKYAAENGHTGARWKLARMYADGDGVPENEYESYLYFLKIIQMGAEPGSPNESYVADALVEVANFIRKGIPKTTVKANPAYARSLYLQAAINYGHPQAQFMIGMMMLNGEGGEKNVVQAARWFQLASQKGHIGAQAMLGDMLCNAGKTIRGLAMITAAYNRANQDDRKWIGPIQERVSAELNTEDLITASTLAGTMMSNDDTF